jgi:aminomethyltransferase
MNTIKFEFLWEIGRENTMTELLRTPLFDVYKEHGGKTIDFGGWELPVQFSSIKDEHEVVRTKAGLFDVSHMGEFTLKGEGAEAFLQSILTNDVSKVKVGKAQYNIMCYPDGGSVDDLIIYKKGEDDFFICVNASNIEKDFSWMMEHKPANLELMNISDSIGQVALQGPLAAEVLQKITDVNLSEVSFFGFQEGQVAGVASMIARTGYTGEDGFEVYASAGEIEKVWSTILEVGAEDGVLPCGLGARDTLRFEACLPLYGQELSADISPVEAGMGFAVKTDIEADFIGKSVLKGYKENGAPRKVIGVEMIDRGIPRHGYPVYIGDELIGEVTTGTQVPTSKRNIGLALLKTENTAIGTQVEIEIRGKRLKAEVVTTPFYKRERK